MPDSFRWPERRINLSAQVRELALLQRSEVPLSVHGERGLCGVQGECITHGQPGSPGPSMRPLAVRRSTATRIPSQWIDSDHQARHQGRTTSQAQGHHRDPQRCGPCRQRREQTSCSLTRRLPAWPPASKCRCRRCFAASTPNARQSSSLPVTEPRSFQGEGSRIGHALRATRRPAGALATKRLEPVLVTLTESSEVFPSSSIQAPSSSTCSTVRWCTATASRGT